MNYDIFEELKIPALEGQNIDAVKASLTGFRDTFVATMKEASKLKREHKYKDAAAAYKRGAQDLGKLQHEINNVKDEYMSLHISNIVSTVSAAVLLVTGIRASKRILDTPTGGSSAKAFGVGALAGIPQGVAIGTAANSAMITILSYVNAVGQRKAGADPKDFQTLNKVRLAINTLLGLLIKILDFKGASAAKKSYKDTATESVGIDMLTAATEALEWSTECEDLEVMAIEAMIELA